MTIGVVGKYIELQDAYKSVYESITHAGIANTCKVNVRRIDAEDLEKKGGTGAPEGPGRHPGPGRIRRPRHRGQDRGGPLRPGAARSRISACASASRLP